MTIKAFLVFIFLFFSAHIKAQEIIVDATRFGNDSLDVQIKNISVNDTILFSLYKQTVVGKKWITNLYDVFCDITNPKTSIFIISPKQSLNFRIHFNTTLYTDEKIKSNKIKGSKNRNRIFFKGNKKGLVDVKCIAYSNVFK